MKKLNRMLILQIFFGVLLLILILIFFIQGYINELPQTQITLENTTIIAKVVDVVG